MQYAILDGLYRGINIPGYILRGAIRIGEVLKYLLTWELLGKNADIYTGGQNTKGTSIYYLQIFEGLSE